MAFSYASYSESEAVRRAREEANAHSTYKASQDVLDAKANLAKHENNKIADWTGGQYGQALQDSMDRINNREKFSYDMNADALYNQYKQRYMQQGRLAMADTIGQAASLTGGYGNSYAESVGAQAYQGYLQGLNDVVPQLYQMAYDRYNQEGQDMYNQHALLQNAYNTEYGEYRDRVGDWQTELNRLTDAYNNVSNLDYSRFSNDRDYYNNKYNAERSFDYGLYSDNYNRAFSNYQQQVSEDQFNRNLAFQYAQIAASAARSAGSGGGSRSSSKSSTDKNAENKIAKVTYDAYNRVKNALGGRSSGGTSTLKGLYGL